MPIPALIGWGLAVGGGAALGTAVGTPIGSYISANIDPSVALKRFRSWWHFPVMPPTPQEMINAWNRGLIRDTVAQVACKYHGANFDTEADENSTVTKQWWYAAKEAMKGVPDAINIINAMNRGWLREEEAVKAIQRSGADVEKWMKLRYSFMTYPDPSMIVGMMEAGRLDAGLGEAMIETAGGNPRAWQRLGDAWRQVPPVEHLMVARNRGHMTDEEFREYLRFHRLNDPLSIPMMERLRESIPGVSDIIHMVVKEAFSPDIANKLKFYHEYPKPAEQWMQKLGYHAPLGFNVERDGVPTAATWLDLYWAAHWTPISPGQSFEMLHRLRPDNIDRYRNLVPGVEAYDLDQVKFWLRVNDYPPGVRDQLAAISYRPLRLVDIRGALRIGLRDREWAISRLRDRGYAPEDAETAADYAVEAEKWRRDAARRRIKDAVIGRTAAEIEASYQEGIIDREQATIQLGMLGHGDPTVSTILDLVDAKVSRSIIRTGIVAAKRDYYNGTLSQQETVEQLARLGVVANRIVQYIALWTIERSRTRRQASTAQVLRWLTKGLINGDEARRRLQNLGWNNADAAISLAEARGNAAKIAAQQQATMQRDAKARAAENERLQKELDAQKRKMQADMRRDMPRATLTSWLKKKIIGRKRFRQLMLAGGYSNVAITRYIREAIGDAPSHKAQGSNGQAPQESQPP